MSGPPRRYGPRLILKLVATGCVLMVCGWLASAATWSNLNDTTAVGATFSAASDWGPPGAPTAVATTPGDGQVAVSWTAPSSNGGSMISGYTATAAPSGQSCSTTGGTSCTITGLTNGSTQSITVTAANVDGGGAASSVASATPYPASLFTAANGISLWLDGADSSTLDSGSNCTGSVSAGGSVGCWEDKSGFGENFTQPASGNQPALGTLNGLGAINFTSVGQVLNSINSSDTYQTVFLAVQPQTTASGWEMFFGQAGSDYSIRQAGGSSGPQFSSPNNNDWAFNTGTTPLDWTNGLQATGPALGVTSIITDQAASPQSFSTSVSSSFAANGYTRGMLGNVAEVIAFSGTLSTTQRRNVEDYLARKWGTTITPDPPGTPTVTAGTSSSASVTWGAPAYNGGSSVTGYTATASPGGQTCTTSGATSCTVTGLTSGTSYTFTVTAANSVGTGSSSPSSAAVTPIGLPGAPTALSYTATTTALAVSWSAPSSNGGAAISSYTASATPGGATCTSATTSCTISGLTASTTYRVTVTASNSAGTGPASSQLTAITATPPTTNVLSLTAATGAYLSGSNLYYRPTVAGSFKLVDAFSAPAGPASVTYPAIGVPGWTHNTETVTTPSGGPYTSSAFSWSAQPNSPGGYTVSGRDNAGNTSTTSLTFIGDQSPPSGGTISYATGLTNVASVPITTTNGTDSGSGVKTASGVVTRDEIPLNTATDSCIGSFPNTYATTVTLVGGADTSVTSGHCYEYRYSVADNVGNVATYPGSQSPVMVDTTPKVTAITSLQSNGTAGDGQLQIGDKLVLTFNENLAPATVPTTFASATEARVGSGVVTLTIPGITNGAISTGSGSYLSGQATSTATFGGTVTLVNGATTIVTLSVNSLSGGATAASSGTLPFVTAPTITGTNGTGASGTFTPTGSFRLF